MLAINSRVRNKKKNRGTKDSGHGVGNGNSNGGIQKLVPFKEEEFHLKEIEIFLKVPHVV